MGRGPVSLVVHNVTDIVGEEVECNCVDATTTARASDPVIVVVQVVVVVVDFVCHTQIFIFPFLFPFFVLIVMQASKQLLVVCLSL